MAISKQDSPQNNFVAGLVTEASPLTFPPNASLDEVNFKLNRDGTRSRRLGMDFEDGYVIQNTGYTADQLMTSTRSFYRWPNPNGTKGVDIGVIQMGGYLFFVNLLSDAPSANVLNGGVPVNTLQPLDSTFEYAIIGGYLLVVCATSNTPFLFNYNVGDDTIQTQTAHILVRDTVGVSDGLRVDERPPVLTNAHKYNLMNQGWITDGIVSTCGDGISAVDCTHQVYGVYPSNADVWTIGRIEDVQDSNVKKYDPNIAARFLINGAQVAQGHFIIDAFDRGTSRMALTGLTGLPLDREMARPRTVATYAGRAWYSGMISTIQEPDARSPNFNGIILFSQVMNSPIDLVKCYQEADPTNPEISDGIDTDGGVINIPEASTIIKLLAIRSSLFVFAENGIWEIRGGDAGFKAFEYQINKISNLGVSSSRSIVEVNGSIFFWCYDGIYQLVQNEYGIYDTQSITIGTIQQLYNSLPDSARRSAKGYYDAANNKLRWIYYSDEGSYTGSGGVVIGGGNDVTVPFDLQAMLDAGVANILAGVGSDYRLNVDINAALVAFQHKDAVYNGDAGPGPIRPAIGLTAAGIAMGFNDTAGAWHNAVAIEADGDATFLGTVAANSILAYEATLGSINGYTIAEVIEILDNSDATFNLQAALDAGVGFIKAGVGGNYEMIVDDTLHYAAFKHKDAVFDGTAAPGAGHTAVGISANGIAMGFNDPTTGVWTNSVAITAAGDATFLGTIQSDSLILNDVVIAGNGGMTLQDMIDDIATFSDGSFNLQPALDAGVTNIVAGIGSNYRMIVDTANAFCAFQHKDAVFNGNATPGLGIRPAVGISSAGIGMGYNSNAGTWFNSVVIDATGNAIFAGTIAANSVITNSATVNGVAIGTIQSNSSNAAAHIAATGNVHNVSMDQVNGDLDDIDDGATYFKTNATQVTGATRASNALDSASDYIRSIQSTKIVVSAPNPSTGVVFDGSGIRMYQGGSLKVNIPTSGDPSFSGNISGGGDINITGLASFNGNRTVSGYTAAVHANSSLVADYGLVGRTNKADGGGIVGVASSTSSSTAAAVRGIATVAQSAALVGVNNAGSTGLGLLVVGTSSLTGNTSVSGTLNVVGTAQCDSLRIDQTPSTGAGVATFNANNKPGGSTTNTWMSISANGSTRYFPVWA